MQLIKNQVCIYIRIILKNRWAKHIFLLSSFTFLFSVHTILVQFSHGIRAIFLIIRYLSALSFHHLLDLSKTSQCLIILRIMLLRHTMIHLVSLFRIFLMTHPAATTCIFRVAWLRSNNLVLSWLMNSITKDIRSSLIYFTTTFDIWEKLRIRYLRSDGPRVFCLEKSVSSIAHNLKSVTEYFSEFKALWDEYISYCPISSCKYGNLDSCSCNILKHLTDWQQSDYVMKFLVGLHDSYSAVKSQLLL